MANRRLEDSFLQGVLDDLQEHGNNVTAAARARGEIRTTFASQVSEARARKLSPTVKPSKPRIRVPARTTYQPTPDTIGKAIRVMVWGCAHDAPDIPDKSRFRHAGLLASDLGPDYIVDLGDSLDLDSLSRHPAPGSMDDRERPFFRTEMASLEDAYGAFDEAAPSAGEIPRFHLHGNHENRAWKYESMNPSADGVFTTALDQVFARYGFTIKNWSEWLFLGDVGFIHAPLTIMGREYGGKTAENTIMNEATFSVVWSHTHKHHFARRPKIGIGNSLASFNTGSFMPHGYLKRYAGLSMTGWTYSIHELTLRDGQIESARTWSVQELSERYS